MYLHSDTFQANQSLIFLLNDTCLAEKQLYSLWFDPTKDRTHDLPHASHYSIDAIFDA